MTLSARRREADIAAARASASAVTYRRSVERLQARLRRDWKLPLASGLAAGAIAAAVPLAATVRAGSAALRLIVSLSGLPYAALGRLSRNAARTTDYAAD